MRADQQLSFTGGLLVTALVGMLVALHGCGCTPVTSDVYALRSTTAVPGSVPEALAPRFAAVAIPLGSVDRGGCSLSINFIRNAKAYITAYQRQGSWNGDPEQFTTRMRFELSIEQGVATITAWQEMPTDRVGLLEAIGTFSIDAAQAAMDTRMEADYSNRETTDPPNVPIHWVVSARVDGAPVQLEFDQPATVSGDIGEPPPWSNR